MSLPTILIHTTSAKTNDTTKIYPVITTPDLNNLKEKNTNQFVFTSNRSSGRQLYVTKQERNS